MSAARLADSGPAGWRAAGHRVSADPAVLALLHAHAIHLPAATVAVMLLGWHIAI